MKNTVYILLALVTLFLQRVSGEENSSYYFTHINGDNGLSSSNVKAIIQDSYGFMWFGTKDGLNPKRSCRIAKTALCVSPSSAFRDRKADCFSSAETKNGSNTDSRTSIRNFMCILIGRYCFLVILFVVPVFMNPR